MELDIKTNITNDLVIFNNYDFVKQQVLEFVEKYNNIIVSEEAVDSAKRDRATLNNVAKALNSKRIDIEKKFKEQFEPFKAQVNSLIEPIEKASKNIDIQIKGFEEREKEQKYNSIKEYFENVIGDLKDIVKFEMIYDIKWLNKNPTIKNIQETINQIIKHIQTDFEILNKEEKATYLKDFYLNNKFDLSLTMQEKARIEAREKQLKELEEKKVKEQQEQMQKLAEQFNQQSIEEKYDIESQPQKQEEKQTPHEKQEEEKQEQQKLYKCSFEIVDTKEKLQLLKDFLINNNINYKRL